MQTLEIQLAEEPQQQTTIGKNCMSFYRINALKNRCSHLQRTRDERAEQIARYRVEISGLYELLQTPAAERLNVSESDFSKRAVDTCEKETTRLLQLKQAKMKEL